MANTSIDYISEVEKASAYTVIKLLMSNGLERMSQAADAFEKGDGAGWDVAMTKAIGVINGLRSALDVEQGGELASNLDHLYEYMLNRLEEARTEVHVEHLVEVYDLLEEIKSGWDGIEESREASLEAAVA